MNNITLIGNICRDLELKETEGGIPVINFVLAVRRGFLNKKQETDFINIQAFGKQAENVFKYCKKGSKIAVLGELHIDTYSDGESIKSFTKVSAKSIQFLSLKNEIETKAENEKITHRLTEDDIPF